MLSDRVWRWPVPSSRPAPRGPHRPQARWRCRGAVAGERRGDPESRRSVWEGLGPADRSATRRLASLASDSRFYAGSRLLSRVSPGCAGQALARPVHGVPFGVLTGRRPSRVRVHEVSRPPWGWPVVIALLRLMLGRRYGVDAGVGVCECPDHQHRGVAHKHLWAVRLLGALARFQAGRPAAAAA